MQKFEQIIQQALAKIDASNPKMRQKIYESIWLVQEKALAERNISAEQKQAQREKLTRLLKDVEMRRRAAQPAEPNSPRPAPAPPQAENAPEPDYADQPPPEEDSFRSAAPKTRREEPAFAPEPNFSVSRSAWPNEEQLFPAEKAPLTAEPSAPRRAGAERGAQKTADDKRLDYLEREVNRETARQTPSSARRRLGFGFYLTAALSALVALFVAWSFYNSFGSKAARGQRALSGPMQQNNYAASGWTEVFSPANIAGLNTRGAAQALLHNEPDAKFIRITAQKGDDAAALEVGEGALKDLRGKTATFKLVARSADNAIGQLSLVADFGKDAPPRRYSFELAPTAAPLLFRLDIPRHLSGAAKFYLGTDEADGKPHEMDIFALLLRASDTNGH